jgi:hypothetical protein
MLKVIKFKTSHMKDLETIQAIDYIFKECDYKYKENLRIVIWEDNGNHLKASIISVLVDEYCIEYRDKSKDIYSEWEYKYTERDEWIYHINTLLLFQYKRKLLWKVQKSIINSNTLESLARFIWDSWNAQSIIDVLQETDVPDYLIIYPNTKWRMVNDIFKVLATSIYGQWHQLLFSIIEEFLSPIRFSSIQSWIEAQNSYSEYFAYDWFEIVKGRILPLKDKRDMYDVYYENKEWKVINSSQFENIKDMISNTEYKQITVKKKNWKPHSLEWSLEVLWDETKFVELRKKYPNSDINTKNYKWKTQKYEITEKLKFENSDD